MQELEKSLETSVRHHWGRLVRIQLPTMAVRRAAVTQNSSQLQEAPKPQKKTILNLYKLKTKNLSYTKLAESAPERGQIVVA